MGEKNRAQYKRFIKFCIVGGSGVFVNLGVYALLTRILGMGKTLFLQDIALIISIELSIISNFLLNDFWTFSDRKVEGKLPFFKRLVKFHLVSLVGSIIQWSVARGLYRLMLHFHITVLSNITILGYHIKNWDDLLTVLIGVMIATFWNFFVNLFWTWKKID